MEIVLQLIIVCKTGFYGTNCKDVMCNGKLSTVCSGNGNCTSTDNCVCKIGFFVKAFEKEEIEKEKIENGKEIEKG
jgi:hypothetical protein